MVTQKNNALDELLLAALRDVTEAGGRPTMSSLAKDLGISRNMVARTLGRLEAMGFIEVEIPGGRTEIYRLLRGRPPQTVPDSSDDLPAPIREPVSAPTGATVGSAPASMASEIQKRFNADSLDQMVIALPLQELFEDWDKATGNGTSADPSRLQSVMNRARVSANGIFTAIIDLNIEYPGGVTRARQRVLDLLAFVGLQHPIDGHRGLEKLAPRALRDISMQYLVVRLQSAQVRTLVELDRSTPSPRAVGESAKPPRRAIHRIWPDNIVQRQTVGSTATIKADAARSSFGCTGRGIVWAVVDSGIDGRHPHFAKYRNLEDLPSGVAHQDFVDPGNPLPLVDTYGHGTHVAGVIAGGCAAKDGQQPMASVYERDQNGNRIERQTAVEEILGVAPECKLVSLKVLGDDGKGGVTEVMAALEQVLRINGFGKSMLVHGVNLSLGYVYDPQWFACGHSPLCEVVNRLARSGVCVVTAAGNSGYGDMDTKFTYTRAQGMVMSINDPGNAQRAITVGSTHREAPHTYGVSYFSSKGPTGDGRSKPDLLAPGEKIISCRSSHGAPEDEFARYIEDSGTSMAAPHVSGAIAALLSARREFIGKADEVKQVLMDTALDLGRDRNMQGSGLLNLFSALQSI
jgi:subtilisin family serine protease